MRSCVIEQSDEGIGNVERLFGDLDLELGGQRDTDPSGRGPG